MSTYIGVDGGGTKTQVFLIDNGGGATIIAPSSNPNVVGWNEAQDVVTRSICACLAARNLKREDVRGLSICMSGVDRPAESARLHAVFQERFPNSAVEIKNDALAALAAGTRGQSGVVLIAGTGSIAVGESTTGQIARAGGYGYLLGDEGSGFAIGRAGLMAAIQGFEGRASQTALWERAMDVYDVDHTQSLIPLVYASAHPVNTIAKFAKEVVALADSDSVADQIIAGAVSDYLRLVEAVVRDLAGEVGQTTVLAGGLFTNTDVLVRRLAKVAPAMRFQPLSATSAFGSAAAGAALRAVKVAFQARGLATDAGISLWQTSLEKLKSQGGAVQEMDVVMTYG
ncbi:N-acetylglucosamine kinase [Alicyclobacillus fastidiosus]|uniref:BadF/BadG/BcrA/BcrD ATPase family protein n=1 Tax=Alicyclobacillus fastidiosus TaxID=392011 RepID=A0ABV5AB39_9BACL|nr:BadF/BadG/BcrA/BcrD ATPase family protein [Alicyclobacillus fastidiosus]WEH10534.1 BadF/BadG/BcrA/BcrD ATPase family protein [Alicyclobacillus fastidiosus]